MTAIDLFQRVGNLAAGGVQARRLDGKIEEVACARFRRFGQRGERGLHGTAVPRRPDFFQTGDLRFAHGMVVDFAGFHRLFLGQPVLIDANDHILSGIDTRLFLGGTFLDLEFGPAGLDSMRHAAHRLDLLDNLPRRIGHVLRQLFHQVAAAPRVDDVADVSLFLDQDLGVSSDARRKFGGHGDRFVEGIGVQRLGTAKHGRQRLDRGAHHVVVGACSVSDQPEV